MAVRAGWLDQMGSAAQNSYENQGDRHDHRHDQGDHDDDDDDDDQSDPGNQNSYISYKIWIFEQDEQGFIHLSLA